MTDADLIAKRLAFIEDSVEKLRRVSPSAFESDEQVQGYALYRLQTAIQAAIDVALHIVSDERVGEPRSYGDAFLLLAQRDILPRALAAELKRMAGMRNVIAHVYVDVDLGEVRKALEYHLDDLLAFVAVIRPLVRA